METTTAFFTLLAASCAAQAGDIIRPAPLVASPYSRPLPGRVIDTHPRMVTDLNTRKTTTIVPVLPARSNSGIGVYRDGTTGKQFMVIDNNIWAR